MSFVEDLAPMFADFAVIATVGAASVQGIFDNAYQGAFSGLVPDSSPSFTCATAEVSSVVVGDTLTLNATPYTICAIEPDGTGVTVLKLK